MRVASRVRTYSLIGALLVAPLSGYLLAVRPSITPATVDQKRDALRDGQHDFDFEFGTWKAHVRRLLHPLTGSNEWVDLEGTSIVRPVWDGRANLGELVVDNGAMHLEGLSLRLYNPESRQWSIRWANSKDGELGAPMIGGFKNGRGEFFNQELFQGAAVYVRFIFSSITPNSFRLEQAFSNDGGATWETNWIATFTRQREGEGGKKEALQ